jgi:hypothetical protein
MPVMSHSVAAPAPPAAANSTMVIHPPAPKVTESFMLVDGAAKPTGMQNTTTVAAHPTKPAAPAAPAMPTHVAPPKVSEKPAESMVMPSSAAPAATSAKEEVSKPTPAMPSSVAEAKPAETPKEAPKQEAAPKEEAPKAEEAPKEEAPKAEEVPKAEEAPKEKPVPAAENNTPAQEKVEYPAGFLISRRNQRRRS